MNGRRLSDNDIIAAGRARERLPILWTLRAAARVCRILPWWASRLLLVALTKYYHAKLRRRGLTQADLEAFYDHFRRMREIE
jgi:hypothetical protein